MGGGQVSEEPFTPDLSVFPSHIFLSSAVSLSPHHICALPMDIHESTEWTSHQQRLTEVLGARKGLRDEKQAFRSISYCQRGADLFLSSRSSVRQVSGPPICGFGCCCFMQSFYYSLFSPGEHHSSVCPWLKKKKWKRQYYSGEITLQQCVSGSLFCTCSLHYMMLIGFYFFLLHSVATFLQLQSFQGMNKRAQTCQEGLLLLHF